MDGWMNGVLGHFYALSRLNWAGPQGGSYYGTESLPPQTSCYDYA